MRNCHLTDLNGKLVVVGSLVAESHLLVPLMLVPLFFVLLSFVLLSLILFLLVLLLLLVLLSLVLLSMEPLSWILCCCWFHCHWFLCCRFHCRWFTVLDPLLLLVVGSIVLGSVVVGSIILRCFGKFCCTRNFSKSKICPKSATQ